MTEAIFRLQSRMRNYVKFTEKNINVCYKKIKTLRKQIAELEISKKNVVYNNTVRLDPENETHPITVMSYRVGGLERCKIDCKIGELNSKIIKELKRVDFYKKLLLGFKLALASSYQGKKANSYRYNVKRDILNYIGKKAKMYDLTKNDVSVSSKGANERIFNKIIKSVAHFTFDTAREFILKTGDYDRNKMGESDEFSIFDAYKNFSDITTDILRKAYYFSE